jgi:hypothetical protein
MKLVLEAVKPKSLSQPEPVGHRVAAGIRVDLDVCHGELRTVESRRFGRRPRGEDIGEEPPQNSPHHLGSDALATEASIANNQGELGRASLRDEEDADVAYVLTADRDREKHVTGRQPVRDPELLAVRSLARGVSGNTEQSSQFRIVGELGPSG